MSGGPDITFVGPDYCPTCGVVEGECASRSGRDHPTRKVWRRAYRVGGAARPKRSRTERPEAPELAAASRRFARALARRAAEGDDLALEQLVEVRAAVDEALGDAARAMHGFGYSWTEIGDRLGTTRQNARQRFGARMGEEVSS